MIVRIVKLTLKPSMVNRFLEDFNQVKNRIRSFDGCLYTELLAEPGDTGVVFTYTHWESAAHLENYRNSELFRSTWSRVKPMFESPAQAWTLDRVDSLK